MGKYLRIFMCLITKWLSSIFSYNSFQYIKSKFDIVYTVWVSNAFAKIGTNPIINYPIFVHGGHNIFIGDNFQAFRSLRIETFDMHNNCVFKPELIIGNNVSINNDCHIGCINQIFIGDNVLIASRVFITDHFHGNSDNINDLIIPPSLRLLTTKGPVVINSNVWIGEGVCIMPGVTIGENSIIGANSVVTKSIPANSIVVGVPAKVIKQF